jgi:LPS sulfotransferase NodH
MKISTKTEQMLPEGDRVLWRKCYHFLGQLVSLSSTFRRFILCRAVSLVVSRRQQGVRLGVLRIFWMSYAEQPVSDPLFIICEARTGSTLLGDYLNSHPMVACEFEILNRGQIRQLGVVRSQRDVRFYLDTLFKAIQGKVKCGKIHFDHFDHFGISIDHLLRWFPQARFIVLYRASLLDQFVSLKLAEITGCWIATCPEDETNQEISIDMAEMLAFVQSTKNLYNQIVHHPSLRGRHLTVSYEELASNADRTFKTKIWPFLGIPPFPLKTVLRKQNRRSTRESISNFHEIESLLCSGELEQRFDSAVTYE